MTSEEARAVAETAKFGQQVVKAGVAAAGYLASIVQSVPADLVGLAGGDWLGQQRKRNLHRMIAKTEEILVQADPSRRTEASPSLLIPLMRAASDESRESLQDLWAALLARSVLDDGKDVRREFFAIVQALEPIDALVLLAISKRKPMQQQEEMELWAEQTIFELGITQDRAMVSVLALRRLGCIDQPQHLITAKISALGRELLLACDPKID